MTVELIESGLLTMVQGRPFRGQRHLGLPLAGAADPVALALANWLAGNVAEMPALETAFAPITLRATSACSLGIQGAAIQARVNSLAVPTHSSIALHRGDIVALGAPATGCHSYIAINGGIAVEARLGATSTYLPARFGGLDGTTVATGLALGREGHATVRRTLPPAYRLVYANDFLLRYVEAPESEWVAPEMLLRAQWTVNRRANRMGIQLDGPLIEINAKGQLESSAVFPGTIQCPPSGLPFLLGPDAQTTGGYPRIGQIIRADLHLVGQMRTGARLRLQRIERSEAQRLACEKISLLQQLQPDFRLD